MTALYNDNDTDHDDDDDDMGVNMMLVVMSLTMWRILWVTFTTLLVPAMLRRHMPVTKNDA